MGGPPVVIDLSILKELNINNITLDEVSRCALEKLGELTQTFSRVTGVELTIDRAQAKCIIETSLVETSIAKWIDRRFSEKDAFKDYITRVKPSGVTHLAIAYSSRLSVDPMEYVEYKHLAEYTVESIFKQGIVVRTTDTGEWYYIGGISRYWASGKLIVYQGGQKFESYGVVPKRVFKGFIEKTGGIGIIPIRKLVTPSREGKADYDKDPAELQEEILAESHPWDNPPLFTGCGGSPSNFWNLLGENKAGVLAMYSLAPILFDEYKTAIDAVIDCDASIAHCDNDIEVVRRGRHYYYLTDRSKSIMREALDYVPTVYFGIGVSGRPPFTPANQPPVGAYSFYTNIIIWSPVRFSYDPPSPEDFDFYRFVISCRDRGLVHESVCDNIIDIYAENYNKCMVEKDLYEFITTFSDAVIGAPVFSAIPCSSECSEIRLVGLVAGYGQLTVGPITAGMASVIPPPSSFTSSAIMEYAKNLNIHEELNVLIEGREKFKRAVRELSAEFPRSIATAASLRVNWNIVDYEEGLFKARLRAQELYYVYNKVVKELTKKPPTGSHQSTKEGLDKVVRWFALREILENPRIGYATLRRRVEQKIKD